jgi:peptidoglycan/xylan/chitin deacetylase (PgdA/CDA1 family)
MISVFFRFDDYAEISPTVVESQLVEALQKHGMCATFSVVPSITEGSYHVAGDGRELPLGPDKIRFLQEAVASGAVDVAAHGWNHRTVAKQRPHSEFVGLPLEAQVDSLSKGKALFRHSANLHPTVFVPPWNAYDRQTLEALSRVDYVCLSANRFGPVRDGLRFVPITADLLELRDAVASARNSQDPDPVIGVILHPYDFKGSGDSRALTDAAAFDAELAWLATQKDVAVVSISELARKNATLDADRFRANQPLWFESIVPPFVPTTSGTGFFRSTACARQAKARRAALTTLTYLVAVFISFGMASTILNAIPGTGLGTWTSLCAAAALAVVASREALKGRIHFSAMLVCAFLVGIVVSGLAAR